MDNGKVYNIIEVDMPTCMIQEKKTHLILLFKRFNDKNCCKTEMENLQNFNNIILVHINIR